MDKPLMERLPDSDDSRDTGFWAGISLMTLRAPDRVYEALLSPWGARGLCEADESYIHMELLMNDESLHG